MRESHQLGGISNERKRKTPLPNRATHGVAVKAGFTARALMLFSSHFSLSFTALPIKKSCSLTFCQKSPPATGSG
jgi:hypothetical protein